MTQGSDQTRFKRDVPVTRGQLMRWEWVWLYINERGVVETTAMRRTLDARISSNDAISG